MKDLLILSMIFLLVGFNQLDDRDLGKILQIGLNTLYSRGLIDKKKEATFRVSFDLDNFEVIELPGKRGKTFKQITSLKKNAAVHFTYLKEENKQVELGFKTSNAGRRYFGTILMGKSEEKVLFKDIRFISEID